MDQFPVHTPDFQWFDQMVKLKSIIKGKNYKGFVHFHHNRSSNINRNNRISLSNASPFYLHSNYYIDLYCSLYRYNVW